MNKLRDNRGETLIESLVSVLIAVLAFAVLATSVVTAEKINAQTRNTDVMFRYDGATKQDKEIELKVAGKSGKSGKSDSGDVTLYESNGYYYYNYKKTGVGP